MVLVAPIRLAHAESLRLVDWDTKSFLQALRQSERDQRFSLRPNEADASALSVFDLPGTSSSPFPIGLIAALDICDATLLVRLKSCAMPLVQDSKYFADVMVAAAVIRIFENGHASMILVYDFQTKVGVTSAQFCHQVSATFNRNSPKFNVARVTIRNIMQELMEQILKTHVQKSYPNHFSYDGQVSFISTFYFASANWRIAKERPALSEIFRSILQPEPDDRLLSQSPRLDELVIFTSGYHIFIHRGFIDKDGDDRLIELVSLLIVMNMLYIEMDYIKNQTIRVISSGKIPLFLPRNLSEKVEILYNQIMISSTSWRRDVSSFVSEINIRWKVENLKDYCSYLIKSLEGQSARRRAILLTVFLTFLSVVQIVSIIEDGWQIIDRIRSGLTK